MRIAREEEKPDILKCLKEDIANCVYLYIDIKKYGVNTPDISVWVTDSEGLYHIIIMKYYNSMQIYVSDDKWDLKECYELILQEKPLMISGKLSIIQSLYELKQIMQIYEKSEGYVFLFKSYRPFQHDEKIELAQADEMEECARLLCEDKLFAVNYTVSNLERQLKDRLKSGMGRNYIIRRDDKIIAHIATYAEEDKIAVTSGLVVHPEHRQLPLGTILESYLVTQLKQEGYEVYTFVMERKRAKLLKAMGAQYCGQYGKLTRKGTDNE